MKPLETITDELNAFARSGHLVSRAAPSLFGPREVGLADGSAFIRRVTQLPSGRAGAIFYWVDGWELWAHGKLVARWVYLPRDVAMKVRAYGRAIRWLHLKVTKAAVEASDGR